MFKKSLSAAVSAALIVTAMPFSAIEALAANFQGGPRLAAAPTVSLNTAIPALASGITGAALPAASIPRLPSVSALNAVPALAGAAAPAAAPAARLTLPSAAARATAPAAAPAINAPAVSAAAVPQALSRVNAPKATAETGAAALSSLYEGTGVNSAVTADASVAGAQSAGAPALAAATSGSEAKASAAVERRSDGGSLIGLGVGAAAVVTVAALLSKDLRNILARAWNAMLGIFGLGVKKLETPEVMAQRIVDQLNAAKPVYNRKVQDASTMVEKLKLQIEKEKAQVAELEKSITAILSDSDPNNDTLATGMIKQQKILQSSIQSSTEQLALAEKTLEAIKDERARFFGEREEMIAKINAKLTQAKAAEIRKQMADLKGGFQVGDLKDNMDKFEQAVDDKVAEANGAQDSVDSNPDEIIKKAKDQLKDKQVQDEIARRKAEIAAKNNDGKAGGKLAAVDFVYFGAMGVMLGVMFAMHFPILGAAGLAAVTIGLNIWSAKRGVKRIPYDLAAHENRAVAVGMVLNVLWVGATGAFAFGPLLGAAIALGASVWHSRRDAALTKTDVANTDDKDGDAGGKLPVTIAPLNILFGALYVGMNPMTSLFVIALFSAIAYPFAKMQGRVVTAQSQANGLASLGLGGILGGLYFTLAHAFTPWVVIAPAVTLAAAGAFAFAAKRNDNDGGLIAEVGIGAAALVALGAIFSKDFRNILARAWNAMLGLFGLGVKKLETPEVMAQRIIDQLNAAKPVYNRKVQDASTLVEKLKLQISNQTAKSAELDKTITALLSQSGQGHDDIAGSMIKQKQTLDASTTASQEQLAIAQTTLEHIKDERARFFGEREEMIAKINAKLTQAKAAEIRKQIADLKGGFQVGDLKDNMDKFEQAVDDKVAEANGAQDSVDSNPDEIIKKAKDQLKDKEIQDEIARRKADIAAKNAGNGKAGGAVNLKWGLVLAGFAGFGFLIAGLPVLGTLFAVSLGSLTFSRRLTMQPGSHLAFRGVMAAVGVGMVAPVVLLAATAGVLPFLGLVAPAVAAGFALAHHMAAKKSSDGGAVVGGIGDLAKRFWNALLGIFGLGVKKLETPEVMAQRIVDQLNAAKPVYNRKVQDASTMVEKLNLQIEKEKAQVAELEKSITAILSDSDPNNDTLATGMIKQQKILQSSIQSSTEQLALAEKTLEAIKDERARFFGEREEMIAKINAKLTQAKAAEIRKQMADLKGGFQVGDLKDNMDKFEQAVDDKVAEANGAQDSVDSNPDEIIKKAKDQLKDKEVQDEIARRKAEIAAKNNDGKAGGQLSPVGTFAKLIGIGFALYTPFISSVVFAVMGLIALIMAPSQAQKLGRSLAVIGLGTLGAGALAMVAGAKLGLAIGAFGSGVGFVVPGALALAAGLLAAWRAHQAHAEIAGSVTIPAATAPTTSAPAPVTIPTPAPAGSETSTASSSSGKASVSFAGLGTIVKRFWNALLGIFGLGVKKMETPEVMAQRLIDQLNAAKPVYNQKVRDASTLVEKLKLQVASQTSKAAELDKTITALLAAGGEKNETLAASALQQKKTLDASTAATKEQLASAQTTLGHIQEERARFFSEREEAIAKINAGLTKAKAAEIKKQMADLKGGFQIGDLKDNMDRFEDAVNDRVAGANGAEDSVDSNPDEIIKKAKESMQDKDISDELARRKAEIAAKSGK